MAEFRNLMTFEEAVRFIDNQVSTKIGRRLTNVEKLILEAAWEDYGYEKVASKSKYELNYLRGQVAPKLWMLLSPIIGNGTKVTKKKLRLTLEAASSDFQLPEQLNSQESETTISTSLTEIQVQSLTPVASETLVQGQLPDIDISSFCGRKAELSQLKQLVISNRCIVLYGPVGIGKSALVAKLVEEFEVGLQQQFAYVVWQSVSYAPPLNSLLINLLEALPLEASQKKEQKLPESVQDKTSLLIDFLKKNHCLLILDGAENWLQGDRSKSFNIYGEKYSEYSLFFRRLVEEKHDSCLVLTSLEPFKDLMKLQNSGRPSYSLKIAGLDLQAAKAILRQQGLTDEPQWEKLLEHYLGNPSAIRQVASRIENYFGGEVSKFLNFKTALGSELYKEILLQQCRPGRLTSLEKQILLYLVEKIVDAPLGAPIISTFTQLVNDMQTRSANSISLSEMIEAVEALTDRSLIIVSKDKEIKELLLDLPAWIKDYVIKRKRVKLLGKDSQEERAKLLSRAYRLFNPQSVETFFV